MADFSDENSRLKRTIEQMGDRYLQITSEREVLLARFDTLSARNAEMLEDLLQTAEAERDTADVEIAAVKADRDLLAAKCEQRIHDQRDRNALWAENRRLRDVIVWQAEQIAGLGS